MSYNVATRNGRTYGTLLLGMSLAPEDIGRAIAAAREARGWTQLAFALEAHVSPSSVQRWEGGQPPPVRELIRIAGVLGIDPDQLVEPEADPRDGELLRLRGEVAKLGSLLEEVLTRLPPPPPEPQSGRRRTG